MSYFCDTFSVADTLLRANFFFGNVDVVIRNNIVHRRSQRDNS